SASGLVGVRVAMVPVASSVTVAGASAAAPAARRVKVAVVIVAAATGLLNVAVTVVLRGTLVAPGAGDRAVTVRGVAVEVPSAAAPAARRVKVAIVIVAAFTGLLSVAVTVVLRGTPVAPGAGDTAVTASGVVVKLHTEAVPSAVPATSVTVAATVAV